MLSASALRNEWRVLHRHPLVWLALIGVAGFSVLVARGSPIDPGATAGEALLRLNLFFPAYMLPFIAGALAPSAFLREIDWDMADIFGSYPTSARQWLAARLGHLVLLLLGACAVAETAFVAVLRVDYPKDWLTLTAQALGWLIVLQLPACLLWASALAWLASRKAHAGLLYVSAGFGWLGYMGLATLTGTPLIAGSITAWEPLKLAMLVLDPYAATALVNPMPEQGPLQWRWLNVGLGRLFWLGITLLLLWSVVTVPMLSARTGKLLRPIRAIRTAPDAGRRTGRIGIHLRYLALDRVFPLLVVGWPALFLPEVLGGIGYGEPLTRIVPDSRDALNRVVWDVLPLAASLLLVYAADRLCRLYQTTRMHELYGATAHRPLALIAVQFASLGFVALGSVALTGLAVAAAQLLAGSLLNPGEYLVQLGLSLLPLVVLAALFVAVHALVRSRLFANLGCLFLVVLGQSSLAPAIGLYHPLWKVMASPLVPPDHVWGYANGVSGHFAFLAFWATLALALLLFAAARNHRGQPTPQVRMVQALKHPLSLIAAPLLCLAVWQGEAINRTLRAEGALETPYGKALLRADYERGYARWMTIPQPVVEAIRAEVDFHPNEGRVEMRAALRLVNRSGKPIAQVLVGQMPGGVDGLVKLERATVLHRDARLGQTVFRLDQPMLPGERRELTYRGSVSRSGLQAATFPLALRDGFSSLPAAAVLPVIGFERQLTLRNPLARKELGLPELNLSAPSQLATPLPGSLIRDRVLVDALISTPAGSFGIGQGRLLQRWEVGGRGFFHFRTVRPIRNALAFLSVAGTPQIWPAGQVTVWTHTPDRLLANDMNVLAMRDTMTLLGNTVAPYPGADLHLIAIPEIGPSGYALPQILLVSHRLAFRAKPAPGAGFNQVYRRAAHETAHQWFGHLLGHGIVEERAFLVESLAKYTELVVIERRFGKPAMEALVAFERDRYRQARLNPDEAVAPLIDAEESEDMYSRATLAFACLRSRVDDEPILAALKATADDSRANDRPATSIGFLRTLKTALSPKEARAIDALFHSKRPIQTVEHELGCNRQKS